MYQFLKTHFSLLMCSLVILMGCTNKKISREFSDTMKDGSRVVITIEYKPKSVMNSKGEKFGSYYFIAKHFFSAGQNAKADDELNPFEKILEKSRQEPVPRTEYAKTLSARYARIYISFYDREGHLLLKGFGTDGYTWYFSNHKENTFDGGMEWKGQFDEGIITVENFRDIHSITVEWR